MNESTIDIERIKNLVIEGLNTDGGHHKQWFLERVLEELGFNLRLIKEEQNYLGYDWEDGIAP